MFSAPDQVLNTRSGSGTQIRFSTARFYLKCALCICSTIISFVYFQDPADTEKDEEKDEQFIIEFMKEYMRRKSGRV